MYSYADRYLFQANIRHDGSSRFAKKHRWGTFPSFSAGWVLSEENFMKNLNWEWLSFLKIRATWGALGNERIGDFHICQPLHLGTLFSIKTTVFILTKLHLNRNMPLKM